MLPFDGPPRGEQLILERQPGSLHKKNVLQMQTMNNQLLIIYTVLEGMHLPVSKIGARAMQKWVHDADLSELIRTSVYFYTTHATFLSLEQLNHRSRLISSMIPEDEVPNFEVFKDCLSTSVISRLAPESGKKKRTIKGRKNEIKPVASEVAARSDDNDAAELADFIEVGESDLRSLDGVMDSLRV